MLFKGRCVLLYLIVCVHKRSYGCIKKVYQMKELNGQAQNWVSTFSLHGISQEKQNQNHIHKIYFEIGFDKCREVSAESCAMEITQSEGRRTYFFGF